MTVRCPDLAPVRKRGPMKFWTAERDAYLREWFCDDVKIHPAILAYKLRTAERMVKQRLAQLGLRRPSYEGQARSRPLSL